MRDLDNALAALRGGTRDGRPRRLGCLVPAVLAIGAAMVPAIGAFVALEPGAGGLLRSPQEARGAVCGQSERTAGAPAFYTPFTAFYSADPRRASPHA